MSTPSHYCIGCGKSFTSSGYWSHLTQSQNPSCQAILDEQLTGVVYDSDDSSCDNTSDPSLSDYAADFNFGRLDEDRAEGCSENVESDGESMEVDEESTEVDEESTEDGDEKEDADQRRMDYGLQARDELGISAFC